MSSQHLTPMLACAQSVTMKALASVGRKFTAIPGGDPIAKWAFAAFRFVDDPGMLRPPPAELTRIGERVERGEATSEEQLLLDACALPLRVWTRVDDALRSAPDPLVWESDKAKVLQVIEAALAELVPALTQRLLDGAPKDPLRVPQGITVFARPEPGSPYLWRDESVGEEPEEGARRECAPDVYEALCCAVECPELRQATALERAAIALRLVGRIEAASAAEREGEAAYGAIPAETRARIEAAEKALAARTTTAEEREILRAALFCP